MCPGAQALPEELSPRLWAFFRAGETGVTKCRPPWGPSTAARGLWGGGADNGCAFSLGVCPRRPPPHALNGDATTGRATTMYGRIWCIYCSCRAVSAPRALYLSSFIELQLI
jgi:hypothetical protein